MPVKSLGSYLPVLDSFLAHWAQVNAHLGGTAATQLKLAGGYALADLQMGRDALQAAQAPVESAANALQMAQRRRDALRESLMPTAKQLRAAVRDRLSGTPYERALPTLPPARAAQSAFLQPLADMADVWERINGDALLTDLPRPLVMPDGTTLAQFRAQTDALRAVYTEIGQADADAKLMRERRDALLPDLRARLLQYRRAIAGRFVPTEPLVAALPAISAPYRPAKLQKITPIQ